MNSGRAVNEALAAIPGMAAARVRARLSDGPTNSSYHVAKDGEDFVLRVDKPEAAALGLNRANEMQVCKAVAAAGLAPEPVYFDHAAGVFMRRFLPGRSWLEPDLARPGNLARLAVRLQSLHSLAPVGVEFDPLAAVRRYTGNLNTEQARVISRRAERLMRRINLSPPDRRLCHNDLVCQNVLETGEQGSRRLMLIDWEYSAVGDPYFDLAVVVRHHGLDRKLAIDFLQTYLDGPATTDAVSRLERQCDFYACLLELWRLRVTAD